MVGALSPLGYRFTYAHPAWCATGAEIRLSARGEARNPSGLHTRQIVRERWTIDMSNLTHWKAITWPIC
jgi:hypothetical protein